MGVASSNELSEALHEVHLRQAVSEHDSCLERIDCYRHLEVVQRRSNLDKNKTHCRSTSEENQVGCNHQGCLSSRKLCRRTISCVTRTFIAVFNMPSLSHGRLIVSSATENPCDRRTCMWTGLETVSYGSVCGRSYGVYMTARTFNVQRSRLE